MAEHSSAFDEIMRQLTEYSEEVDAIMQDEIDKTTSDALKSLESAPNIPKKTGKYKKSFFMKCTARGAGYKRNVIANRHWRLTHLLEYGHLTRSGTRSRAFPHWERAQKIADTLAERMEKRLEGGGED